MKKHILLIFSLICVLGFSLVGCTNNDKVNKSTEKETHSIIEVDNTKTENSKKEENNKADDIVDSKQDYRNKCVEANFVEINGDRWNKKDVFVEGTIESIDNDSKLYVFPTIFLKKETAKGIESYAIILPDNNKKFKIGDNIKIYGSVYEQRVIGAPSIISIDIEKI
ncbi:hypothetical protein [uncultured Clostridium sp.]|uniref:hypothetical protein n=1 Tax=uncultured Clostridium sp. TaxID=59620 RepID=UPI0028E34FD2|nr:hypothetical protein [uncultured Clostridium sp.]